MKRSVILTDRLGPDILSAFWTKGQVLHRERAHLKVPGFSIVLNALLTRKLPTFLSRLNEISGGCEKIAPVSGSFWSILKLLRMIAFTGLLRGWNVWLSLCKIKLVHLSTPACVLSYTLLWHNMQKVILSNTDKWAFFFLFLEFQGV